MNTTSSAKSNRSSTRATATTGPLVFQYETPKGHRYHVAGHALPLEDKVATLMKRTEERQSESRMREIRPSGSMRGSSGAAPPPVAPYSAERPHRFSPCRRFLEAGDRLIETRTGFGELGIKRADPLVALLERLLPCRDLLAGSGKLRFELTGELLLGR